MPIWNAFSYTWPPLSPSGDQLEEMTAQVQILDRQTQVTNPTGDNLLIGVEQERFGCLLRLWFLGDHLLSDAFNKSGVLAGQDLTQTRSAIIGSFKKVSKRALGETVPNFEPKMHPHPRRTPSLCQQ